MTSEETTTQPFSIPDTNLNTLSTQLNTQSDTSEYSFDEYINWLSETPKVMSLSPRSMRQSKQEFEMPLPTKEGLGNSVNYTMEQLKATAAYLRLRRSGTKAVLRQRIHSALVRSHFASCIQSHYRGHLFRRYLQAKGLGGSKRPKGPTNNTELLSLEPVESIDFDNLINVPNDGGKDTLYSAETLNMLIENQFQSKRQAFDPYTNLPFKQEDLARIREERKLAIILKRRKAKTGNSNLRVERSLNGDEDEFNHANLTRIVMEICSHLDSLGHITDPEWFLSLTSPQWRLLNNNLSDIWVYRAQLPANVRMAIGGRANLGFLRRGLPYNVIMRRVIDNIRCLIMSSQNRDHQALGAIYVLIALAQVSIAAADAMPTMYEAGVTERT